MEDQNNDTMRRLHPRSVLYSFLSQTPRALLVVIPLLLSSRTAVVVEVVLSSIIGSGMFIWAYIRYRQFRYSIDEHEVKIESGILTREHRSIPIDRIQNIEIIQKPLHRILGIANVSLDTGGSKTAEGEFECVSPEEGYEIRRLIRAYQEGHPETGTIDGLRQKEDGIATDRAEQTLTLFTMSPQQVFIMGIYSFSLLYLALIGTGLQYVGENISDREDFLENTSLDRTLSMLPSWGLVLTLIVITILLAWLGGITVAFLRYSRFRLTLEEGKFHTRSGLLTITERTIPRRRIQAMMLRANPLMQRNGWRTLQVQVIGGSEDEEKNREQMLVPFARTEECLKIASMVHPFSIGELHKVSPRLIRRTFTLPAFIIVLLTAIAWIFLPDAIWTVLLLIPTWIYARLRYRNHGYSIDQSMIVVRRGVWHSRLWLVPVGNVQSIFTTSSFFQRRLGLATLHIDTAGGPSLGGPDVVDLPEEDAARLLRFINSGIGKPSA